MEKEKKKCTLCGELKPSNKGSNYDWANPDTGEAGPVEWVCFDCVPKQCREGG